MTEILLFQWKKNSCEKETWTWKFRHQSLVECVVQVPCLLWCKPHSLFKLNIWCFLGVMLVKGGLASWLETSVLKGKWGVCNTALLCLFWCLWKAMKQRIPDDQEWLEFQLQNILNNSVCVTCAEWETVFLDFIDGLSC